MPPQSAHMRCSTSPVSPGKQRSSDADPRLSRPSSSATIQTTTADTISRRGSNAQQQQPRGTKRPSSNSVSVANAENVDMLAALASVSTLRQSVEQEQEQSKRHASSANMRRGSSMSVSDELRRHKHVRHHDYTLQAYSLSATKQTSTTQTAVVNGKSSIASASSANYQSTQLTLDPQTNLPPRDIIDELLLHVELEFNIISKVVHPKAFMAQHAKGRCNTFLLLTVMANNSMYSTHPAITSVGAVAAARVFVDRAKLFAPEAFENPSVTGCQALLLLSLAYMHQGMLNVSSHYSSATLKILEQLGVCKMDDDAWSNEDDWISGSSWLDREQIRRVIWGSFSIDTFLSLMMHKSPYVMIDLSGVNRPCAPTMWYIGNDNIETLNFPASAFRPNPNDTAYVTALKKIKMSGVSWRINGNTVQLNFAMLGNAILRGISDPHYSKEHLDKLVVCAYKSLSDWVAEAPEMPDDPTFDEVQHTLLLCSAALCLKSVVAPYLITRGRNASDATANNSLNSNTTGCSLDIRLNGPEPNKTSSSALESGLEYMRFTFDSVGDLNSPATVDRLLSDYIRTSFQLYRYMRLTANMIENNSVPPMFLAHSTMISGGIFAACAYAAPTLAQQKRFVRCREFIKCMLRDTMRSSLLFRTALEEIERIEEMVQFLPRRLDPAQLEAIRDMLVPDTIEAVINKRFCQFMEPIRQVIRKPQQQQQQQQHPQPQLMQSPLLNAAAIAISEAGSGSQPAPSNGSKPSGSCLKTQLGISLSLFGPSKISNLFCPRMSGSGLSNSLCALFGKNNSNPSRNAATARSATTNSDNGSDLSEAAVADKKLHSPPQMFANHHNTYSTENDHDWQLNTSSGRQAKSPPDYKLSFTSISSLLVALSIASKDASFFDSMFGTIDALCKKSSPCESTAEPPLSSPPMRPTSNARSSFPARGSASNDRVLYSASSQTPATATAWMMSSGASMRGNNSSEGEKESDFNRTTTAESLYSSVSPPQFLASKSMSPEIHRVTQRSGAAGPSSSPPSSAKHANSIGDLLN
ncbi:hypothetical protein H4R99_001435 [Coemansia sp. RSA 1722]|nr:hypothetical protein IWW45_001506 [Coemansia sp. RSA 485]KAJ2601666.1 hypothetical protein GGF39_001146 [Coemansia sp. RSA 1721]KAJ2605032.1 hypothetical protein H4R99_001435 [Coemansia sp. RSA 1722]